jgi:hypothetical protein
MIDALIAGRLHGQPKQMMGKSGKPFVVPGMIGHGLTVFAGLPGAGTTSTILPLALRAAGLHGGWLKPKGWRHVIYVTEDVDQANRIVSGISRFGGLDIKMAEVRERFHLVKAVRMDAAEAVKVTGTYRDQFTRVVSGVKILPLVVFDTKSAIFAMRDENDPVETSRLATLLTESAAGLPVWLACHLQAGVDGPTFRGSTAILDRAEQVWHLFEDGARRSLVQGRTQIYTRRTEMGIQSRSVRMAVKDAFGADEQMLVRWGVLTPCTN